MQFASIGHILGILLALTGIFMLFPAGCALYYGEDDLIALLTAAVVAIGFGAPGWWLHRKNHELSMKDGVAIAVFGWFMVSAVSGLPFMLHGSIPSFTDAFFEMMSGYTTTGATILQDIETLPHGLLLWRSATCFLGGMGFITLTVFFLPRGMGGLRLFRAESSPGQVMTKEKFKSRTKDTIVMLWLIYLGLNGMQVILLIFGGMPFFDALCNTFGTVSTAGYSPKNSSIAHYNSAYIDWVVIVFMFLGGCSFLLLYRGLSRDWEAVRTNTELRWYILLVVLFCGVVSLLLYRHQVHPDMLGALRYGSFQVVSLLTTTGFTTADYELWPLAAQMFLYVVCLVGACAGSTSSGIKVVHFVILGKYLAGVIKKVFIQPMAVVTVRLNKKPVSPSVVDLAICYFILNIVMVMAGGCVLALLDPIDYTSSMSAIIAALMNIGPGFGAVGPSHNWAFFSDGAKWFLAWNMLVGRLEMFSVLVMLHPDFWKK